MRLSSVDLEHNAVLCYKLKQRQRRDFRQRARRVIRRRGGAEMSNNVSEFVSYYQQLNELKKENLEKRSSNGSLEEVSKKSYKASSNNNNFMFR